jgi:hypothetical protein
MLRYRLSSMFSLFALLVALLASSIQSARAQTTATPIPTFDPTFTAPSNATAAPPTSSELIEPITLPLDQSNLTVLTGNVQRPNGIAWLDGALYVACSGDWTIYEIQAEDGRTISYTGGLRDAHALYAESGSNDLAVIWAPDFRLNTFVRATRAQTSTIAEGDIFDGPWGMTYLTENEFLVTNLLGDTLVSVSRDGETRLVLEELASPAGVVLFRDFMFIANNGSTRRAIEWYPSAAARADASPEDREGATLVSGLSSATGLAMDDQGMLYVAYSLGTRGVVGRVNPLDCIANGGCTGDDVEVVLYSELAAPLAGLTISPDRRMYIHTMFAPDIYWAQLP